MQCLLAQSPDSSKMVRAAQHVNQQEYYKAIRIYENLHKEDPDNDELIYLLAETYSLIPDHDKSLFWITRIIERDKENTSGKVMNLYIDELQNAGKYEIAKIWLDKIRLELMQDSINFDSINYDNFFGDTTFISVQELSINSFAADFSPVKYKDGLVFYSNRNKPSEQKISIGGDIEADIFYSSSRFSEKIKPPEIFNDLIGYGYYEGTFDFYNGFTEMIVSKYLAAEENVIKDDYKISGLKLFHANIDTVKDELYTLDPLPFNIHGFSVAHPSISDNGEVLVFSSNIPGGAGGTDLYIAYNEDGEWSPPENLGPSFNTPFDEFYPYLYGNSVFFSSNRPEGMGKMDIYKQDLSNVKKKIQPKNLGAPINSTADDFNLVVTNKGIRGCFVSNRPGGRGKEDIYSFLIKSVSISDLIKDILADNSFEDLEISYVDGPEIGVRKMKEEKPGKAGSDRNDPVKKNKPSIRIEILSTGEYDAREIMEGEVEYPENEPLKIIVKKGEEVLDEVRTPGNLNLANFYDIKAELLNIIDEIPVEEPAKIYNNKSENKEDLKYRVQIAASATPLGSAKLKQIYQGPNDIESFKEEGWYKYYIGEYSNYFEADYIKRRSGVEDAFIAAYRGNRKQVLMNAIKQQYEGEHFTNHLDGEIIDSVLLNYRFNQIQFVFEDDKKVQSILKRLKNDTQAELVIQTHTDKYGSSAYNLGLSAERARKAVEYFINNGVSDSRITIRYYGEKNLLKDCPDQVKCKEEIQRLNRRIELLLVE
jgi:outer membrane protein OmpA-like peptidoglycan-associated protein